MECRPIILALEMRDYSGSLGGFNVITKTRKERGKWECWNERDGVLRRTCLTLADLEDEGAPEPRDAGSLGKLQKAKDGFSLEPPERA